MAIVSWPSWLARNPWFMPTHWWQVCDVSLVTWNDAAAKCMTGLAYSEFMQPTPSGEATRKVAVIIGHHKYIWLANHGQQVTHSCGWKIKISNLQNLCWFQLLDYQSVEHMYVHGHKGHGMPREKNSTCVLWVGRFNIKPDLLKKKTSEKSDPTIWSFGKGRRQASNTFTGLALL